MTLSPTRPASDFPPVHGSGSGPDETQLSAKLGGEPLKSSRHHAFVVLEHRRTELGVQIIPIGVYLDGVLATRDSDTYQHDHTLPRRTVAVVPLIP